MFQKGDIVRVKGGENGTLYGTPIKNYKDFGTIIDYTNLIVDRVDASGDVSIKFYWFTEDELELVLRPDPLYEVNPTSDMDQQGKSSQIEDLGAINLNSALHNDPDMALLRKLFEFGPEVCNSEVVLHIYKEFVRLQVKAGEL